MQCIDTDQLSMSIFLTKSIYFSGSYKKGHSEKGHHEEKKGEEEEKKKKFHDEDGDEGFEEKKGIIRISSRKKSLFGF